jgi:uncharacterized protein (TIGR03083 family)
MLPFADAITAARDELTACATAIHALDAEDRARPVPDCPGWDVDALSRHLVSAVWAQAEAFHRARMEFAEQPGLPDVTGPADSIADRLDRAHGHLAAAIAMHPGDDWPFVPLPFAVIPAIAAANGILLEYGVHRRDLERALGREFTLSASTCTAVLGLAGALLPAIGKPAGDEPLAYRLTAPSATVDLVWDAKAWSFGDASEGCIISGDDESIALLGLGRRTLDHPSITVNDPHGTAAKFTDYFAGL